MFRRESRRAGLAVALIALACACNRLVDDWVYEPQDRDEELNMMASAGDGGDLGFAVGGAMDINNFRENIENDYLPLVTDITYEGAFYDYYFDTGESAGSACEELFCPSYVQMLSSDPLTGAAEPFLSVGLNSNLTEADFSRRILNIVVVLDISGSMSSGFADYYYDGEVTDSTKTKMTIANESVVAMLDHLLPEDSFGMVLFDDQAYLAKPLRDVGSTDMEAIKEHILEIGTDGGTNMEAGYRRGTELFDALGDLDTEVYENRIVFLTDAMPNTGDTSEDSLMGLVEANAERDIFTTFVGIGVDFNTTLIEAMSKVRGANYYSVHNEDEFRKRLDDEFDFMVTPLVFDLQLALSSEGYSIAEVYGSPEADEATGTLLFVNTLFPSRVTDGETRGGLILVKLEALDGQAEIDIAASYADRGGDVSTTADVFDFDAALDEAPNSGVRKGILLTRYVRLMREWISAERELWGLENPQTFEELSSLWERTSVELTVSEEYQVIIAEFLDHFRAEAEAIGDESLGREIEILEKLVSLEPTYRSDDPGL